MADQDQQSDHGSETQCWEQVQELKKQFKEVMGQCKAYEVQIQVQQDEINSLRTFEDDKCNEEFDRQFDEESERHCDREFNRQFHDEFRDAFEEAEAFRKEIEGYDSLKEQIHTLRKMLLNPTEAEENLVDRLAETERKAESEIKAAETLVHNIKAHVLKAEKTADRWMVEFTKTEAKLGDAHFMLQFHAEGLEKIRAERAKYKMRLDYLEGKGIDTRTPDEVVEDEKRTRNQKNRQGETRGFVDQGSGGRAHILEVNMSDSSDDYDADESEGLMMYEETRAINLKTPADLHDDIQRLFDAITERNTTGFEAPAPTEWDSFHAQFAYWILELSRQINTIRVLDPQLIALWLAPIPGIADVTAGLRETIQWFRRLFVLSYETPDSIPSGHDDVQHLVFFVQSISLDYLLDAYQESLKGQLSLNDKANDLLSQTYIHLYTLFEKDTKDGNGGPPSQQLASQKSNERRENSAESEMSVARLYNSDDDSEIGLRWTGTIEQQLARARRSLHIFEASNINLKREVKHLRVENTGLNKSLRQTLQREGEADLLTNLPHPPHIIEVQIAESKAEIDRLLKLQQEISEQVASLKTDLSTQGNMADLLREYTRGGDALRTKIEILHADRATVSQQLNLSRQQVGQLKRVTEVYGEEKERLREELNHCQSARNEAVEEANKLKKKVDEAVLDKATLQNALEKCQKLLEELTQEVARLNQKAAGDSPSEDLQATLDALNECRKRYDERTEQMKQLTQEVESLNYQLDGCRRSHKDLTAQIARWKEQSGRDAEDKDGLGAALAKCQMRHQEAVQTQRYLNEEIASLKNQSSRDTEDKKGLGAALAKCQMRHEEAVQAQRNLTTLLNRMNRERDQTAAERESLQEALDKCLERHEEVAKKEGAKESINCDVNCEEALKEVKWERDRLARELTELTAEHGRLAEELDQRTSERDQAFRERSERTAERNGARTRITLLEQSAEEQNHEVEKVRKEVSELKKEIQNIRNERDVAFEDFGKLQAEAASLGLGLGEHIDAATQAGPAGGPWAALLDSELKLKEVTAERDLLAKKLGKKPEEENEDSNSVGDQPQPTSDSHSYLQQLEGTHAERDIANFEIQTLQQEERDANRRREEAESRVRELHDREDDILRTRSVAEARAEQAEMVLWDQYQPFEAENEGLRGRLETLTAERDAVVAELERLRAEAEEVTPGGRTLLSLLPDFGLRAPAASPAEEQSDAPAPPAMKKKEPKQRKSKPKNAPQDPTYRDDDNTDSDDDDSGDDGIVLLPDPTSSPATPVSTAPAEPLRRGGRKTRNPAPNYGIVDGSSSSGSKGGKKRKAKGATDGDLAAKRGRKN